MANKNIIVAVCLGFGLGLGCSVGAADDGFQPGPGGPVGSGDGSSSSDGGSSGGSSTSVGSTGSSDAESTSDGSTSDTGLGTDSSTSDTGGDSTSAGEDTGGSSTGPVLPPPTCDEIYGSVDDFELCSQQPNRCTFAVDLNGDSCGDLCTSLGQTCIDAQSNNPDDDACEDLGENHDCNTEADTEICVCSRA